MDTWPKTMHAVRDELFRRGALPIKREKAEPNSHPGRDAITAAENVTGILVGPTDTLPDMAAKWAKALGLPDTL